MMDAQVDNHLGDSITYNVNGVPVERAPGDPTIPAFLMLMSDDGGLTDQITPGLERWQLKVAKRFVPVRPSLRDSVEHAKLGSRMRVAANTAVDDGDYWLCELQKAPA